MHWLLSLLETFRSISPIVALVMLNAIKPEPQTMDSCEPNFPSGPPNKQRTAQKKAAAQIMRNIVAAIT